MAETFDKEHKNVIADVRKLRLELSGAEFSALFYDGEYKTSFKKNRKGFLLWQSDEKTS